MTTDTYITASTTAIIATITVWKQLSHFCHSTGLQSSYEREVIVALGIVSIKVHSWPSKL